jgi:transposase
LLGVEQWAEIRRMKDVEGLSQREIHRRTGVHRDTIRKALASPEPPSYGPRPRPPSKLDPFLETIGELLADEPTLSGVRIREELEQLGYDGSKTILDDLLRELRPRFLPPPRSFQRTRYRAGELAQFDLCEPRAEIPVGWGQTRRGHVVTCELPYSRAFAGTLEFSKEFSDIAFGMRRCLARLGALPDKLVWDREGRDRPAGPPERAVPRVLRPTRAGLGDPRRRRPPRSGGRPAFDGFATLGFERNVARRSTIELVEDADGVRVDVTSAAEAHVRGLEGPRDRTHPDALFQVTVIAEPGAPWDTVELRASGALGRDRRYLDLAPQSDEARLLAALAGQETVRVRWVTEGVELLYRLSPENRDHWREALATNETRTDEERQARYEEMLAAGYATMSELPFYRRVTPRRPRRTAEPPASPIPFFARRSGGVPSARRPRIAGVRLPPGRRAPDHVPSYWISDDPLEAAGDAAATIARAFAETGLWPLLWPWDEDPVAYLDQPVEPDRVDAVDVEAELRREWDRLAANPAGLVEPVGPRFPGLAPGSPVDTAPARDPFQLAGLLGVAARLMIVPCNRPADCIALIGGLAVEVDAAEISAVIRSWEERFGAVLVAVEPSYASLAITAPPRVPEQALAAAAEQLAFCPPEMVEPGTLEQLGSSLIGASVWPVAWYD